MSRGEIAKLMLLLSLPRQPKILLIDEITNDLDISSRKMIYKKLDEYSFETGAKVIIATNIISDMERFATSIVLMKKGSILFSRLLDDLKESNKKISLRAQMVGKTADPAIIGHRSLTWNGKDGVLVTDSFRPEVLETLATMGIDANLEALSLEEILSGYGE
jgi:ABC-type multidrug transport system ATPase subunit